MQFFAFQLICPSISKLRRFSFSQYLCWCFHCHCYFHCNICCFKSPSKGIANFLTGWSRHVPLWLFSKRFFNKMSFEYQILDVLGREPTLIYDIFCVELFAVCRSGIKLQKKPTARAKKTLNFLPTGNKYEMDIENLSFELPNVTHLADHGSEIGFVICFTSKKSQNGKHSALFELWARLFKKGKKWGSKTLI